MVPYGSLKCSEEPSTVPLFPVLIQLNGFRYVIVCVQVCS